MIAHASRAVAAQLRRRGVREGAAGVRSLSSLAVGSSSHIGEVTYRPLSSLHEALYLTDLDGAGLLASAEEVALDPRSYGYRVVYPAGAAATRPAMAHESLYEDDTDYYPSLGGLLEHPTAVAEPHYYNASFRPGADPAPEGAAAPRNAVAVGSHDEEVAVYESHLDWEAQLRTDEILRQVVTDYDE